MSSTNGAQQEEVLAVPAGLTGSKPRKAKKKASAKGYDHINPNHYKGVGGIEVADVADFFDLGRYEFTAVKYIIRAGKKPDNAKVQDLKKARWYIDRLIKLAE